MPVGDRLRIFRETKNLTQAQLASILGGTAKGLQNNELNLSLPNSKLLLGLHGLGLNVNWLLTGSGPMLLTELHASDKSLVDAERLGEAIAAVDQEARKRKVALSPDKHGKLAALVYQYFMLETAEQEASIYLTRLMELISTT